MKTQSPASGGEGERYSNSRFFRLFLVCAKLAQRFIENDAGRGGEVDAAHLAAGHGNTEAALGMALKHPLRQSLRFAAEQEAITGLKGHCTVRGLGVGAETENPAISQSRLKLFQAGVQSPVHQRPEIATSPAQIAIIEAKTQPPDQMQRHPYRGAQPGDVAGVRRYFRLQQRNVKQFAGFLRFNNRFALVTDQGSINNKNRDRRRFPSSNQFESFPMASRRGLQLDVFALSLLLMGLLVTLCVLGQDASPATGASYPLPNTPDHLLGPLGSQVAIQLYQGLGGAVYILLAAWFVLVLMLLHRRGLGTWLLRLTGWGLLVPCVAVLADAAGPDWLPGPLAGSGGMLGACLSGWLEDAFTPAGRIVVVSLCWLVSLSLTAGFLLRGSLRVVWYCTHWLARCLAGVIMQHTRAALQELPFVAPRRQETDREEIFLAELADEELPPVRRSIPINRPQMPKITAHPSVGIKALLRVSPPVVRPPLLAADYSDFQLPPLTLLEEPKPFPYEAHDQRLREQAALLEKTFTDFNLNVRVVGINTGPVITQYELALETGLRVHKVTCLADDLALNMRVSSVRIVAPIPGKNTVGVEVPNEQRAEVRLKEVMLTAGPKVQKLNIPLFLGKDTEGQALVYDLADMPHLLIAGRTGTGKSVCLNAIILSILMTRRPDQVKMIMIDPKMTELIEYGKIPHLMHPVVRDSKKAEAILAWAVDKMEERYDLLSRARVRNIASYNQLSHEEILRRVQPDEEERSRIPDKMPFIVIIVDEMADLMMTSKREVEGHVIRLAQKSRAAGIHLVVATQKPTVDVITGLIKSNLPARIAFQVSSRSDSRVVLDEMGADKLLGKGDLLFLQPGTSTLLRAQGTYASDVEITRVVEHLECDPSFEPELMELHSPGEGGSFLERLRSRDDLYEQAIEVVVREGRGSVSLLQRALGIGYGRAARLIDFMAEDGLVGTYNGSNAREVLCSPERWDQMKQSRPTAAAC